MTENERREREAFEAWADSEGYPTTRERYDANVYADPRTHAAWWAWKEARASLSASPAVPVAQDEREALVDLRAAVAFFDQVQSAPDSEKPVGVLRDAREWLERAARAALSASPPSAEALDAARYRWLRDHGLKYANVGLGTTCEGVDVVDFRPTFTIPEPAGMRYEDNEWSLDDLDAAIDTAMGTPPADNKENGNGR